MRNSTLAECNHMENICSLLSWCKISIEKSCMKFLKRIAQNHYIACRRMNVRRGKDFFWRTLDQEAITCHLNKNSECLVNCCCLRRKNLSHDCSLNRIGGTDEDGANFTSVL